MHDVKSYDFVKQYFSNPQLLVKAIKEYRRTANIPKGEYSFRNSRSGYKEGGMVKFQWSSEARCRL